MSLTKKISTAVFACLLIGGLIYVIAGLFKPKEILIYHTSGAGRLPLGQKRFGQNNPSAPVVLFGFNQKLRFTEIKVIAVAETATNKNALPMWHLVTDSNSLPVKGFAYGGGVPGMKPYVKGGRAKPLETNVTYRLLVTTSSQQGEHEFSIGGANPAPARPNP